MAAWHAGERSAGNPHAPFEVTGAGNVTMAAELRATAKAVDQPPEPNVGAPVLDPTVHPQLRVGSELAAKTLGGCARH
jgi:hypothetical protein